MTPAMNLEAVLPVILLALIGAASLASAILLWRVCEWLEAIGRCHVAGLAGTQAFMKALEALLSRERGQDAGRPQGEGWQGDGPRFGDVRSMQMFVFPSVTQMGGEFFDDDGCGDDDDDEDGDDDDDEGEGWKHAKGSGSGGQGNGGGSSGDGSHDDSL